jgi:hypothetical protein
VDPTRTRNLWDVHRSYRHPGRWQSADSTSSSHPSTRPAVVSDDRVNNPGWRAIPLIFSAVPLGKPKGYRKNDLFPFSTVHPIPRMRPRGIRCKNASTAFGVLHSKHQCSKGQNARPMVGWFRAPFADRRRQSRESSQFFLVGFLRPKLRQTGFVDHSFLNRKTRSVRFRHPASRGFRLVHYRLEGPLPCS